MCAIEDSLGFAAVRVYGAVDKLKIDGAHYRKDVGAAAMKTAFDTLRNVTSGTSYG